MSAEIHLTETGNSKRKNGQWTLYREDVRTDSTRIPEAGEAVDLVDENGGYRGRGFYSDRGPVAVEVISNSKQTVDRSFFSDRIERAHSLRKRYFGRRRSYRLVNGAGDFLPGLIVDCYGNYLSIQIRTQAMHRYRDVIVDVLVSKLQPEAIVARNDIAVREQIGLESTVELIYGDGIPGLVEVQVEPYTILADLVDGQKTGYYLDQEENRKRLRNLKEPGRCLDCFSYSGAWGLAMLQGGADSVVFVDRSREALQLVEENARENGWLDRIETRKADGFDFLEDSLEMNESFDTVALDPPAFAKSEDQLQSAKKGYTGINLRAMRLLKPSGVLATSSCSAPVDMDRFSGIIRKSAHDAHVSFQVFERRYQSPDHPWLSNLESSRYLTCIMGYVSLV